MAGSKRPNPGTPGSATGADGVVDALLGQAAGLFKSGQWSVADDLYRQVLARAPRNLIALCQRALVAANTGDLPLAAQRFADAIRQAPEQAVLYYNLGKVQKELGLLRESLLSYRQARRLDPENPMVLNNLGRVLFDLGQLDDAVEVLEALLRRDPDHIPALDGLATIYKQQGRFDQAIATHRRILEINPEFTPSYEILSGLISHTELDADMVKMRAMLERSDLAIPQRINLNFGLAKAYEDIKAYDEAFAFYQEANRLKRGTYTYDIAADEANFARVMEVFSPALIEHFAGAGCQDPTPVFIVGMPRSGTTLTEQILASHPQVYGAGELKIMLAVLQEAERLAGGARLPESITRYSREDLSRIGAYYVDRLRGHAPESPLIVDKMTHNFIRVGFIKLILPNAKVIHCQRDPVDTCVSIFSKNFTEPHPYGQDLEELGRYYRCYQRLMAHWNTLLPGFVYTLQYERLVAEQEEESRRLLEYCGLPWNDACLRFFETGRRVVTASYSQVRRPVYRSSIARWKRYERHLEPLLRALAM